MAGGGLRMRRSPCRAGLRRAVFITALRDGCSRCACMWQRRTVVDSGSFGETQLRIRQAMHLPYADVYMAVAHS